MSTEMIVVASILGFGALIGDGDKRAVTLRLRVEARGAHGHDFAAGGEGESNEVVERH